jgi:hypothetical protein
MKYVDDARLGPRWDIVFGPTEYEPTIEAVNEYVNRILKGRAMNPTRCKMKLVSISEAYSNGVTVKFQPVTSGSDENKRFYAATPSGNVEFTVSQAANVEFTVSQAAKESLGLDVAKLGSEFYIDIIPAA